MWFFPPSRACCPRRDSWTQPKLPTSDSDSNRQRSSGAARRRRNSAGGWTVGILLHVGVVMIQAALLLWTPTQWQRSLLDSLSDCRCCCCEGSAELLWPTPCRILYRPGGCCQRWLSTWGSCCYVLHDSGLDTTLEQEISPPPPTPLPALPLTSSCLLLFKTVVLALCKFTVAHFGQVFLHAGWQKGF